MTQNSQPQSGQRTISHVSGRSILEKELQDRKTLNPSYSLRSLASSLEISAASLSQILNGKRKITHKVAKKIAESLKLSSEEKKSLFKDACAPRSSNAWRPVVPQFQPLTNEAFKPIAGLTYFAILGLADLAENSSDPKWVSAALGITLEEASSCMKVLESQGIIALSNGQFRQIAQPITTQYMGRNDDIRHFHRQVLKKAEEAIDGVAIQDRDLSAIVFATSEEKLPLANQMIRNFRRELMAEMESHSQDRVFVCAIQLFPVSHTHLEKH